MARPTHQQTQDRHFAVADAVHFRWTTLDPGFAPLEDALLLPNLAALSSPCLEIGCGEGANLLRLARGGRTAFGVDRSHGKVQFAAAAIPAARLGVSDASALPFRSGVFQGVLIRDVLHHVPDPALALREAARVLAPGGTLLLIEPNGRNPLVRLQASVVAAERQLRNFTPASVRAMLDGLPLSAGEPEMAQPFPLRRLILHPHLGLPALGRFRPSAAALARLELALGRWLPRDRWSYTIIHARRL